MNNNNEIISFSCDIYKVIVMSNFGEKMYMYFINMFICMYFMVFVNY